MTRLKSLAAGLLAALSLAHASAQGVGQLDPGQVWGNPSASQGRSVPAGMSSMLDRSIGSTRGSLLERGASGWQIIAPGTAGLPFVSGGAGADPAYGVVGANGLPTPTASTLGGVQSLTCSSHNWFSSLSTGGVFGCSQPSFADLSGSLSAAQCPLATGSTVGCSKPDGTTITVTGGVLTAVGAVATAITAGTTTTTGITATHLLGSTTSGCTGTTPCLADSAIAVIGGAPTITVNSLSGLTIQDASSSQDTMIFGMASNVSCDPGYIGTPGTGPCAKIAMTPNTISAWQTLLTDGVNGRNIMAAQGGAGNPEIICADTNAFGVPVWLGGNQSGCGYLTASRIGAGQPGVFNFVNGGQIHTVVTASLATGISGNGKLTVTAQSNTPVTFGETFVGAGFSKFTITGTSTVGNGNCSPACTGAGGTGTYATSLSTVIGSETMIGGPSGAEASASIQIWGGSLVGDTQNIIMFFNGSGQANWTEGVNLPTQAGARLGEIAGTGTSADGLFTQTECWSWNGYQAITASGTHLDGNYTSPTNMVLRLCPNTQNPERIVAVFDYNANLFLGTAWTVTTANTALSGALFVGGSTPTNAGLINSVYTTASQQGMTIQNSGGDTGSGHAVLFSRTDGTTEGSIVISASGTAFNTTSDRRLKTDIVPASADEVGSLIDQLQVVDFKFKDDLTRKFIGFIAQDEYAVFPDAISKGDDTDAQPGDAGFVAWGRDDSKLVPLLVREVQSLRQRVGRLETLH
jgi:hypothetical protein